MKYADWITESVISSLRTTGGLESLSNRYLRHLLLAIPHQLTLVREAGIVPQHAVDAVRDLQRHNSVYIEPFDNWFTRNIHRFGQGFDMKLLADDPRILAAKFDRLASHWEEYVTGCRYEEVFAWLGRTSQALAPYLKKEAQFLDIACGVGLMSHTLRLVQIEGHITGMDISEGMLEKAHARGCYDALLKVDVNEGLPVSDQSVDVAICTGAMELLNVKAVLRECSRVVKSGGQIWVSFQHDVGVSASSTAHQNVFGVTETHALGALERWGFRAINVEKCPCAFTTPSPDGVLRPVPYLFICAQRCPWQPGQGE